MAATEITVDKRYTKRVERLIELSVDGHDAYADVGWDIPVDLEDPRLELFAFDPLAQTDWYQRLSQPRRAEVGLTRTGVTLRIGWEFENLLQQGLLARAYRMSNTDASFRYVHTEVMEESQHSLMFHEFVRRHAPHVLGMTGWVHALADPATQIVARKRPTLFFFMVLGGEVPVDVMQRLAIRSGTCHPLVKEIMEIHVEEEARHVSFANEEIRRTVPALSRRERQALALAIPPLLGVMSRLMVYPAPWLLDHYDVPRDDVRRVLRRPQTHRLLQDSVARIRRLCAELDLLTPAAIALWKRAGIWTEP